MRTVEEALALLTEAAGTLRTRSTSVALAEAVGRILTEDVRMDHDVPPFRRAAMDGFALATDKVAPGARFRVVQAVMAGDVPSAPLAGDDAARVMTGAPVPDGARCVVPFEWTSEDGAQVTVERVPRAPGNIVERGAHVRADDVVLRAGSPVTPAALGALASAGCAQVPVAERPRVALIGTGSELVPVDHAPGPGAIRNSNNAALVGQCLRVGAEPVDLGIARDDVDALRAAIRQGLQHDVLLLSGGVSRGDLDLVPGALEAEGVRCLFHRWSVQPGGPIWLGVKERTLVFGLPGNPAGTFVGFEVLVVPALRSLLGMGLAPRRTLRVRYEGSWGKPGPRRRFRPVSLASEPDGTLRAAPCDWRGSGDPFGLASGDALIVFPEDAAPPADGSALLDAIPLHEAALLWGAS